MGQEIFTQPQQFNSSATISMVAGNLSTTGSLSSASLVYDSTGNSSQWNSAYSSVASNFANWNSVYSNVRANSANDVSVYSSVASTSANWNSVYSSVRPVSANWNSVYSNVQSNSAAWNIVSTTDTQVRALTSTWALEDYIINCSDEVTNLSVAASASTFRVPFSMYLNSIRASTNVSPVGNKIIVDVKQSGASVFSTKLSIDSTEDTSTASASAAIISNPLLIDDSKIVVGLEQVGSTTPGKGLKLTFKGYRVTPNNNFDSLLGSVIELPPATTLRLDIPMTTSSTMPPVDESPLTNPSSTQKTTFSSTAVLTSFPVRYGKTYGGSFRGQANGMFIENIQYSMGTWNTLTSSFGIEAWVYLPTANLTINSNNNNTNGIIAVGAPSSGGPCFGVRNNGAGYSVLTLDNGAATPVVLSATEVFPTNQWVHVAATYNYINSTTSDTNVYQNGIQVASSTTWIATRQGNTAGQRFCIGSRDYNTNTSTGWSASFKGYINNVRDYS